MIFSSLFRGRESQDRFSALVDITVIGLALTLLGCGPAQSGSDPGEALFDGTSLQGWAPSGFEAGGAVRVANSFRDGAATIVIEPGLTLSGITSTRGSQLPRVDYELSLEVMRISGMDFFCGLTFPVGASACTFVVGGWSGEIVGLSNIDDADASQNETRREMEFVDNRWYRIRVRVTAERIEAWIDDDKKADVAWKGRKINLRPGEIQKSLPLGIATFMTKAAVRNIRLRRLDVRRT